MARPNNGAFALFCWNDITISRLMMNIVQFTITRPPGFILHFTTIIAAVHGWTPPYHRPPMQEMIAGGGREEEEEDAQRTKLLWGGWGSGRLMKVLYFYAFPSSHRRRLRHCRRAAALAGAGDASSWSAPSSSAPISHGETKQFPAVAQLS